MMGLQATATKRKYEIGACGETGDVQTNCTPAKTSRWSTMPIATSTSTITTTSQIADATTTTAVVSTTAIFSNSSSNSSSSNSNTISNVTSNKMAVASTDTPVTGDTAAAATPIAHATTPAIAVVTVTSVTSLAVVTTPAATAQIPSAEESIAKLEAVAAVEPWGPEPIVDSISRLQAVAVPDTWGSDSTRSTLATTLLSSDDLEEDDDDFEDDFDEDDSIIPSFSPLRYPCAPSPSLVPRNGNMSPNGNGYVKPNYYSEPYPQQNCSRTPFNQYGQRPPHLLPSANHHHHHHHHHHHYGWGPHHNYYSTPDINGSHSQQTIRCAENGKSYLELGSASYGSVDARHPKRCCDGRGGLWCNNSKQCYRERRLKMRNLSMFKLSRFRQVSEQSLYRSVLICNTLKFIDREIEAENKESTVNSEFHQHTQHFSHVRLSNSVTGPTSDMHQQQSPQQQQQHQPHSKFVREHMNVLSPINSSSQQQQQQPQHQPIHATAHLQTANPTAMSSAQAQQPQLPSPSPQAQYSSDNSSNNNYGQPYNNTRSPTPNTPITSAIMSFSESMPPYDHHPLRDSQSGRATPFPGAGPDTDSGYGEEDCTRPINWGSVLSLSSQSALDPLNNNDLFSTSVTSCSLTASSTPSSITTMSSSFGATGVTPSAPAPTSVSPSVANWEYNMLDMDLGLGPELTELLPSWKLTPLSADDILKSVTTPMEPTKMVIDNDMDTLTHIMVGGS